MATKQVSPGRATGAGVAASGTIRVARLFGFDILVHWSWLIIFVLVTWTLSAAYLPDAYPGWNDAVYVLVGLLTSVLFFSSVLAHELSHSLVARRRGIPVESITLFVFGGVSSLGGEPRSARDEFWVAIVGPLTSFGAAVAFGLIWAGARTGGIEPLEAMAGYLALINLSVGVFNLLPGFPLDGGRVLRSAVWGARHSMLDATRVAANVGRVIAGLMIGVGLLITFAGGAVSGVWLMLIGWFLWSAGAGSYQQALLESSLRGLTAASLLERDTPSLPPAITLRSLATQAIVHHDRRAFFVRDERGEVLGLVTLTDLRKAPEATWDTVPIDRAMTPRAQLITVTPETPVLEALRLMVEHDLNQLPVMDGAEPLGLITRAGVLRLIHQRMEIDAMRRGDRR